MNLDLIVTVPGHPRWAITVVVRSPSVIAKAPKLSDGYKAAAWFHGVKKPTSLGLFDKPDVLLIGAIGLSAVDLELVAHECAHAAFHCYRLRMRVSAGHEEFVSTIAGALTKRVWKALQKASTKK